MGQRHLAHLAPVRARQFIEVGEAELRLESGAFARGVDSIGRRALSVGGRACTIGRRLGADFLELSLERRVRLGRGAFELSGAGITIAPGLVAGCGDPIAVDGRQVALFRGACPTESRSHPLDGRGLPGIARGVVSGVDGHRVVADGGEFPIGGGLVPVRSELIGHGVRIICGRCGLVGVGECLVGVGSRLIRIGSCLVGVGGRSIGIVRYVSDVQQPQGARLRSPCRLAHRAVRLGCVLAVLVGFHPVAPDPSACDRTMRAVARARGATVHREFAGHIDENPACSPYGSRQLPSLSTAFPQSVAASARTSKTWRFTVALGPPSATKTDTDGSSR